MPVRRRLLVSSAVAIKTSPTPTVSKKLIVANKFLVGESAHSLHPVGGQGLNLSIRDINELIKQYNFKSHLLLLTNLYIHQHPNFHVQPNFST